MFSQKSNILIADPSIHIRRFQPNDFSSVINIEREAFNEHDPFLYMEFYESNPEGFLVAEINGMVIGFIVGIQVQERKGRIFSLAVNKKYQGRGVGTRLMKTIIDIFRASGVLEISLEVRNSNIMAQKFYRRAGFAVCRRLHKYYNDGEDALLMSKTIR